MSHNKVLLKDVCVNPTMKPLENQVGKTFCGESLERDFGYCFHDGDQWLPEDLRETLKQGES